MRSQLSGEEAQYMLPLTDVLVSTGELEMNALVGKEISLRFTGDIHCVVTGKKIKKSFGEGMSYDAWTTSPLASPSIVHPELSRIHEGIALRDKEWEEAHHLQPHYVYLSRTSSVKVGVTRTINVPSRWIDQGASEAIILAQTPYRQLAGVIEVAMKHHFDDKTNWQKMLRNVCDDTRSLVSHKDMALGNLPGELHEFIFDEDAITRIQYPVLQFPEKIKSLKADTSPEIKGKLSGIKAQYLIFEGGQVFNIRAHAGYRVEISL